MKAIVTARTLIVELAFFFLCGGFSCSVTGLKVYWPLLRGTKPTGDPDDRYWRYVSLGGVLLFIALKGKAFLMLKDAEITRIIALPSDRRYFWLCYSIPRAIILITLIFCMKMVEVNTDQYYASRLIFGSSTCAVGVLLSMCSVALFRALWNDGSLGDDKDGDIGETSITEPLVDCV